MCDHSIPTPMRAPNGKWYCNGDVFSQAYRTKALCQDAIDYDYRDVPRAPVIQRCTKCKQALGSPAE